jgi:hypothetical protein
MARDVERIVGTIGGHPKDAKNVERCQEKKWGMLGDVGE